MHEMDNAVISTSHTSNTELVLQWPHFEAFPALRLQPGQSIYSLENRRVDTLQPETSQLDLSEQDLDIFMGSFLRTINFPYPVMSISRLALLKEKLNPNELDDSTASCLALLTMALGCAGEAMNGMLEADHQPVVKYPQPSRSQSLGHIYFHMALKRIHHAYTCINTEAAQCLLLAAYVQTLFPTLHLYLTILAFTMRICKGHYKLGRC
jgi:hypothetical protein